MAFNFNAWYQRASQLAQERSRPGLHPMTKSEDQRYTTLVTVIDNALNLGLDAKHTVASVEDGAIVLEYTDQKKKQQVAIYINPNGTITWETREFDTKRIIYDIDLKKRTA